MNPKTAEERIRSLEEPFSLDMKTDTNFPINPVFTNKAFQCLLHGSPKLRTI